MYIWDKGVPNSLQRKQRPEINEFFCLLGKKKNVKKKKKNEKNSSQIQNHVYGILWKSVYTDISTNV